MLTRRQASRVELFCHFDSKLFFILLWEGKMREDPRSLCCEIAILFPSFPLLFFFTPKEKRGKLRLNWIGPKSPH